MKRAFSAGGIVFNHQKEVLLTQNSANHYWGFPKGTIDPSKKESSKEAALREVREEGGVVAEIVAKVGDSKYVFTWEEEKIFKVVTFYLMNYLDGDIQDHDFEVSEIGWFKPEEALQKLSFSADKTFLKKALEMLDGQ